MILLSPIPQFDSEMLHERAILWTPKKKKTNLKWQIKNILSKMLCCLCFSSINIKVPFISSGASKYRLFPSLSRNIISSHVFKLMMIISSEEKCLPEKQVFVTDFSCVIYNSCFISLLKMMMIIPVL